MGGWRAAVRARTCARVHALHVCALWCAGAVGVYATGNEEDARTFTYKHMQVRACTELCGGSDGGGSHGECG